ncbi:hypothetical protein ACFU96_40835 [Streptomyces sp. NPDC057620]|uniref:hypothetical protein n=1 Tax=Streptomyces sp. NPDC057620 TaxID=3346185 RepID=UPI003681FB96
MREVTRLCDYLPLALRLAGARLVARAHWSVGDLVQRMPVGTGLLDELTHGLLTMHPCFSSAYQRLSGEERRLFRMLGLCGTGTYSGFDGAQLLSRSEREATEILERLAEARLLNVARSQVAGESLMFRLHTLTGAYAKERAVSESSNSERSAAAHLRRRDTDSSERLVRLRAVR